MSATVKATHTPGPWSISKHGTPSYAPQYGIYADDKPNDHCIVRGDNASADAALIAAAPDLLAALEAILDRLGSLNQPPMSDDELASHCRAAIARARGDSN